MKIIVIAQIFWLLFSTLKVMHKFRQKCVELHFGRFFYKLIWSPWSQSYDCDLQRQRCNFLQCQTLRCKTNPTIFCAVITTFSLTKIAENCDPNINENRVFADYFFAENCQKHRKL
jgi:hypothetical protein